MKKGDLLEGIVTRVDYPGKGPAGAACQPARDEKKAGKG